jgi:hypothetical protein
MKLVSHLGLLALIAFSFLFSIALLAGGLKLWGPPAFAAGAIGRTATLLARATGAAARDGIRASCAVVPRVALASTGYDLWTDEGDGLSFALVDPGHDGNTSVYTDGDHPDFEALTRDDHRPLLWFKRDGVEWVSRDADVLARAEELLGPVRKLGREMGEVGGQMGERGARLGRMGGRLGVLGGRLATIEVRASTEPIDDAERAQLEREAREIREQMHAISAQMPRGRGEDDERLRERMRELGRQQKVATREARTGMRSLTERAIRERRAERLGLGI